MKKILIVIMLFLLVSCSTVKTVYVPVETIKTEYVHNTDSIYVHDSIYEKEHIKGDTVFLTKYKYKIILEHTTDTIVKVDSIPTIVGVDKIVEVNKLYLWLKILMWAGGFMLFYLILKIYGIIIKKKI